jgi:phosphatidylserine/phosphatidylglycerophosphate/cardiolipin synthase-like enzyme
MRKKKTGQGLSVRGITGSNAVLLAMDYPKQKCGGLRGFAIHRTDHTEDEAFWLEGMKVFPSTQAHHAPGVRVSTRKHPIQDFGWADYTAKPGHDYTYRVLALKGDPGNLDPVADVSVDVTTESSENGDHDVYFNRGVGASQEYARRFGNRKPGTQGGDADPAWAWLSRGNYEAIIAFIARAKDSAWGLRVGAYELHLPGVIEALRAAVKRKVDVRIMYDADPKEPGPKNAVALAAARISAKIIIERKTSAISHNKVIILYHRKTPIAVLTGSTNFSRSGVFGHANVVHVVEDRNVAAAYSDYWTLLSGNPAAKLLKSTHSAIALPPAPPKKGTVAIFSPRSKPEALDYYAKLAHSAKDALFMTFAFGMHDLFKDVYRHGRAPLRYALFEKLLGPGVKKEDKPAATKLMIDLRRMVENRFAVGARLAGNALDGWLEEELSGLSRNVLYVHTKFMLIDPLGDDPIVVTGSANFSKASSDANDENMLVIRGNCRIADVYLTEFMRLWEHFAFREWAATARATDRRKPRFLDETDTWWQRHFGKTDLARHKAYFAG